MQVSIENDVVALHKNKQNASESEKLLVSISATLREHEIPASLVDIVLFKIFDKANGLIAYMFDVYTKARFKKCIVLSLEIIYTLVNNFPTNTSVFITAINVVCMSILNSGATATEKVKALAVLEVGFNKVDKCLQNQDHYVEVYKCLKNRAVVRNADTVTGKILICIGIFMKKFSYIVIDHEDVRDMYMNILNQQRKSTDKSQAVSEGLFDGLRNICDAFPLDVSQPAHASIISTLYLAIKELIKDVARIKVKTGSRAALKFFQYNARLFVGEVITQYRGWSKVLLKWLDLNEPDRMAGMYALYIIYKEIGVYLMHSTVENAKEITCYYLAEFHKTLKEKNPSIFITLLAIEGTKHLSKAGNKFAPDEMNALFMTILQNFDDDIAESQNSNTIVNFDILASYCTTIASVMETRKSKHTIFRMIQRVAMNFIKCYPHLTVRYQYAATKAIVGVMCEFSEDKETRFYMFTFMNVFVFQAVVWSCSHHHLADAALSKDFFTIKDFAPFWSGILFHIGNIPDLKQRSKISKALTRELMETLYNIVHKLNVNLDTKDRLATEIEAAFKAQQINDYAIFLNVVDFYTHIFHELKASELEDHISTLIMFFINKCKRYPIISGFYTLLSNCIRISNELEYLNKNSTSSIICREQLTQFLRGLVKMMLQYKDELLISCLLVLLQSPPSIIEYVMADCVDVFSTAFKLGRSNINLADTALSALQLWKDHFRPNIFDNFIIKLVPILDSYLCSKSMTAKASAPMEKQRKTMRALRKRKVVLEIEPELMEFQKKLLSFIGNQSVRVCKAFVSKDNYATGENWGKSSHLKVVLPYRDLKLDLQLDSLVFRTVDLALNCSDRKTKVTACELLQSIVMVFLGESKAMSTSEVVELDNLFKNIAMPLLKLGCDDDLVIQQLFQPLVFQLIHWYTHAFNAGRSHSAILIETLMDGITHPIDSRLRDFSGKCINEFITWTIKQRASLHDDPHMKSLIKQIRFFSSHPDSSKKLGAALIFNNIYKEFREQDVFVNAYSIELLHIFICSLEVAEYNTPEVTIHQINQAVNHLKRIFIEMQHCFAKSDKSRRVPSDIKGSTLDDVAVWILKMTASDNKFCRRKCMEFFVEVIPNKQKLVDDVITQDQSRITNFFQKQLDLEDGLTQSSLEEYLRTLDGFNFMIENDFALIILNQMPLTIYFLETHNYIGESLDEIKSDCYTMIVKLINTIAASSTSRQTCNFIWSNIEIMQFLTFVIFGSQESCVSYHVLEPDLHVLLENIRSRLTKAERSTLLKLIYRHIDLSLTNSEERATPRERRCVEGLLELHKVVGESFLNFDLFTKGLTEKVFRDLHDYEFSYLKQEGVILDHYSKLLQLALLNRDEFKDFVTRLNLKEFEFIVNLSEKVTFETLAYKFREYLEGSWRSSDISTTVHIILSIMRYVLKHNLGKVYFHIVDNVMPKWKQFDEYFKEHSWIAYEFIGRFLEVYERNLMGQPLAKIIKTLVNFYANGKETTTQDMKCIENHLEIFGLLVQAVSAKDEDILGAEREIWDNISELTQSIINSFHNNDEKKKFVLSKMIPLIPMLRSKVMIDNFMKIYFKLQIKVDVENYSNNWYIKSKELQTLILESVYSCGLKDPDFTSEEKYKACKDILPAVLRSYDQDVIDKFYENHIQELDSFLSSEQNLLLKSIVFIMLELLYLRKSIDDDKNVLAILKHTMEAFKVETDDKSNLLIYKRHAYNTSVSIICNSDRYAMFSTKLFRRENAGDDILWKNLVDLDKKYVFVQMFDSIPKRRKIISNIRRKLRVERQNITKKTSQSVQYLESVRLYNSSLSEDVTNFDFTNSVVRNIEELDSKTMVFHHELHLDATEINEHECMGAICGLIQHLCESAVPKEDEEPSIPYWLDYIKEQLADKNTHPNIKIFLVKVIDNMFEYLQPFASYLLDPLVEFVHNGHAGDEINYFVSDVLSIIATWSVKCKPTKENASKLISFLVRNLNNVRTDIFKYHLEHLKLLTESWKNVFDVPFDEILTNTIMTLNVNDRKVEIGIHLLSIFFANQLLPENVDIFFGHLIKCLSSTLKSIYRPCAETLGLLLRSLTNTDSTYSDDACRYILSLTTSSDGQMLNIIEGISLHYPHILNELILNRVVLRATIENNQIQTMCLKIFNRRPHDANLPTDFKLLKWSKLLENSSNVEAQILAMEILESTLRTGQTWNFGYYGLELRDIIKSLCSNINSNAAIVRGRMYQFTMALYKDKEHLAPEIANLCQENLLQGLMDADSENRERVYRFWCEDVELPSNVADRLTYILSHLYRSKTENIFLSYSNYFLLNLLNQSKEFDEVIFKHPLEDCTFEEYAMVTNWRLQNRSNVPMFAETISSTFSDSITPSSSKQQFDQLKSTLQSLVFDPTQNVSVADYSQFTHIDSTLMVDDKEFVNPNKISISTDYRKRRRFVKDRYIISQHFAQEETMKVIEKKKKRIENVKEAEKGVTIYRRYRKGDLPDIQIRLASIIIPLQVLANSDAEISRILFKTLFKSMLTDSSDSLVVATIADSIRHICTSSTQFNTNFFRAILDIVLDNRKRFVLDTNILTNVCQATGLILTGTLILEEYLIQYDGEPGSSKRGVGSQDEETRYWVKMAELCKEAGNWSMVQTIFVQKLSCKESVKTAIKFESNNQWREAQEMYLELINTDLFKDRQDFYYESYFKCAAYMGEWDKIPDKIESISSTPADKKSIWQNLWSDDWNRNKLLPWYISAHVKNVIFNKTIDANFMMNINQALIDPDQCDYLQHNYAEELCMLWLFNSDIQTASQYFKYYINNFINEWQLLDVNFETLRYNKILQLRNMMDIERFVDYYNNGHVEEKLSLFLNHLNRTCAENLPLLHSETRKLYRGQCLELLLSKPNFTNTVEIEALQKSIDVALMKTALKSASFQMVRKYYKKYAPVKHTDSTIKLIYSDLLHLRTKSTPNPPEVLKYLTITFKELNNVVNDVDRQERVAVRLKMFDLTNEIYDIVEGNESCWHDNQIALSSLFATEITATEDIKTYGKNILEASVQNINIYMGIQNLKQVAESYVKLAHYYNHATDTNKAEYFITYVLKAMKLHSAEARQLFPCILMDPNLGKSAEQFVRESHAIPTWMFLSWIPQLLANVDSPNAAAVKNILIRIASAYPQAIMYAYRLSKEHYKLYEEADCDFKAEAANLIETLDNILLSDDLVNKFFKALSYVSAPEVMLRYYVQKLKIAVTNRDPVKVAKIRKVIADDIFNEERPNSRNLDNMKGGAFRCIEKYRKIFEKQPDKNFLQTLTDMLAELRNNYQTKSSLLKDFCPFLFNFSSRKHNFNLEIPGQYDGTRSPMSQHHIKISSLCPHVSIMDSKQHPIKITFLGMDGKEYPFLVKFGEDTRQDQRIQQILSLMNDIMSSDSNNTDMKLLTYQVIPVTSHLGLIQWVKNTTKLEDFLQKSMSDSKLMDSTKVAYHKWVYKSNESKTNECSPYYSVANFSRNKVIPFYQSLVNTLPHDTLKKSLWLLSYNTEHFINIRSDFVKSYAVLCACHWILGIGDRHLNNSLIDMKTGRILGIDFGYAFGTGTQIPIPETVPFRLTPQILNAMEPFREHGVFTEYMINTMRSLRNNSGSLIATLNVFVQEPSLDWLELAEKLNTNISWYPQEKIAHVRQKLLGATSTSIMIEELKAAFGERPDVLEAYINLVKGCAEFDYRARLKSDEMLTVENQVACLIDHASDANLLGRMYVGWNSWI